jgi:hypothetical protein
MTYRNRLTHGRFLLPFPLLVSGALGVGCSKTSAAEKAHDHKESGKEAHDDHGDAKQGHAAQQGRVVHLGAAQRKEFGVQVAVAKAGTLSLKIELTGEVSLHPTCGVGAWITSPRIATTSLEEPSRWSAWGSSCAGRTDEAACRRLRAAPPPP